MKKIELNDLTKYHFLSQIRFSPDGSSAAFLDKICNIEDNDYETCIRLINFPDRSLRKLTRGGKEQGFIYESPSSILFSAERCEADRPKKSEQKTVFYRIDTYGGEAERAFELPFKVLRLEKAAGKLFFFLAEIDLNRPNPESTDEYEFTDYDDYHILEELPYWANGAGFVSRIRKTLGVFDESTGNCRLITEPLFMTRHFVVTEGAVYYSGHVFTELLCTKDGIYRYDVSSGTVETILEPGKLMVRGLACSDAGLFFMASDGEKWGSEQLSDLYFYDKTIRRIYDSLPVVGAVPSSDIALEGGDPFFVRGGVLYLRTLIRFKSTLMAFRDGELSEAFPFEGALQAADVCGEHAICIGTLPSRLQEVFLMNMTDGSSVRLSYLNDEALEDTHVGTCRYIPFVNSDGVEIDGWIIEPKDFDPSKSYPGILDMHGGPRAALGPWFFHEMQCWAGEGYYVFYCNPRGGEGRGEEFADLRGRWGTIDFSDLMEFTDHVLKITPALDEKRLGVTGGSYGGWMTNWIIGHTDRFAAAASQRSFSNWISDFGCSEIGFNFDVNETGATPWDDAAMLWDISPVKYADRVTTPTLFIHSLKDYNCPFSEGMQMFAGLKYHHVPSRVCAFEGENHSLSRTGKPRHRIRRLKEITDWMNRYLKSD